MKTVLYTGANPIKNEWGDIELYRLIPLNLMRLGIYQQINRARNPYSKTIVIPKPVTEITIQTGREGMELINKIWKSTSQIKKVKK